MISIGAYRVFTSHSPTVGVWSLASQGMHHPFYDLGPLMFWLLAVPVHLDPNQGAFWGAAILCGVTLSISIEAVWSLRGWPAAVALALIVADIGWQTEMFSDVVWNPHFGLVFLVGAVAVAWVVASGRYGWWPVAVLFASVAAQSHLIYAFTAVGLAVLAPLVARLLGHRAQRMRWLVTGLVVGVVCWIVPLVQEIFGDPGNLTLVAESGSSRSQVGLGFGMHAFSTAVDPNPIWLTKIPFVATLTGKLPQYVESHAVWWGIVVLCLLAAIAFVAWLTDRRELAALALMGAVVSVGTIASFANFPQNQLAPLDYLIDVLWFVGLVVWVTIAWAVAELAMAGLHRVRSVDWQNRFRPPVRIGLAVGGVILLVVVGYAGLHVLIPAARAQAAEAQVDIPLDRAIARSIEHHVPAGPVVVKVEPTTFGAQFGYYNIDYWGVAMILLKDGWEPGLDEGFSGVATHLDVSSGSRWPVVIVHVDRSTKSVTGAVRENPPGNGK